MRDLTGHEGGVSCSGGGGSRHYRTDGGRRQPPVLSAILPGEDHRASGSTGSGSRSTRHSEPRGTRRPASGFPVTIVRVETDEGVVGIGSGDTMDGFEAFEDLFIGQDPLDDRPPCPRARDDRLPRRPVLAARSRPLGHRRPGRRCPGARRCFGGATDGLPAYASYGMRLPAGGGAESALRLRDEGFRALKIRVDPRTPTTGSRRSRRRATRSVTRWRSWSTSTRVGGWPATPSGDRCRPARSIIVRLAECDVLWVEEPLDGRDLAGLASLREAGLGDRGSPAAR